jgi:hypothetical protein
MKNLRYLLLFQGLFAAALAYPQHTGEWLGAEIEYDLPKKITLEADLEARALNAGGIQVGKYLAQIGLTYRISERFHIGYKNRFEWRLEENLHYYYRNNMILDLEFNYPTGRFKLDYRSRFQRLTKTYINSEFDLIPALHWRNKIELSYDIPETLLEPTVFCETFTPLNAYHLRNIDQIRTGAEVSYPVAKWQSLTGGIMYVNERYEVRQSDIIFQLTWKLKVDKLKPGFSERGLQPTRE